MRTTPERAEEKRQARLAFVHEQAESAAVPIRQMTDEEHGRYPQRTLATNGFGRR